MYILPVYQSQHLGSQLFNAAVAFVKEQHPEPCTLFLHVNRHNRAKHFYTHQGMKVTSRGDFPIGNGFFMNDYIMEKNI
jgi:ribosomal protein S18 acetylase RimI-like enzyme